LHLANMRGLGLPNGVPAEAFLKAPRSIATETELWSAWLRTEQVAA
jgi:hypothetical protein